MLTKVSKTTLEEQYTINYEMFRNRIINGAMEVRENGDNAFPTCWKIKQNSTAIIAGSKVDTLLYDPTYEVRHALKMTVTKADTSVTSAKYVALYQTLEGIQHRPLRPGPMTLSFYAKSSKIGTYSVSIRGNPNAAPSFVAPFSITDTNNNKYTIQIPCVDDFVSDENDWTKDNTPSLNVFFTLMAGSTYISPQPNAWVRANYLAVSDQCNFVDVVGNTFEITGIQLEPGTIATPFESLPLNVNMLLVNRYYKRYNLFYTPAVGLNSNSVSTILRYSVLMRVTPTVVLDNIKVWVSGGDIAGVLGSVATIDNEQYYFSVTQNTITIVRHQAYFISGLLYLDATM